MTAWPTFASHPFWKGLVGGILGVLLVLILVHLWLDHQALHQLITYVNQQIAQQAKKP